MSELVCGLNINDLKNFKHAFFECKPIDEKESLELERGKGEDIAEKWSAFRKDFGNFEKMKNKILNPFNLETIKEKCENLTEDGGVKKLLTKKGIGPLIPPEGTALIKYTGYTEFADEPFDGPCFAKLFDVGTHLLKGFNIAVRSMRKRERASFYFSHKYAYGPLGIPDLVPQSANCLYIIELLDFVEEGGGSEFSELQRNEKIMMPFKTMISFVYMEKEKAKRLFEKGRYREARDSYEKVLKNLNLRCPEDEEDKNKHTIYLTQTYCNLSLCHIKLFQYLQGLTSIQKVLDIDNNHVKGLYLKGKCLSLIGKYEEALESLLTAKKIAPKNKKINEELKYLEKKQEILGKKEVEICQKMMNPWQEKCPEKVPPSFELSPDLKEEFVDKFKLLLENQDPLRQIIISNDIFSIKEMDSIHDLAFSMGLTVDRMETDTIVYLKIYFH